ncbi:MAG TPA: DUF4331 domain-containing protein [Roseiflexaceae bacterium]|nr:DUF4331 domain-containing protein [Roseiflexaceae bacterium]
MSRKRLFAIASLIGLCAMMLALAPSGSQASSHREAPLISRDPSADNTDLYAFVSPDDPDTVTIIANYIPLEEPAGGPNFASFDDSVLYAINVDNDGDSKTDISYEFRFKTTIRNPNTFLYNTGPIASLDDPNWNMPQTYEVTRVQKGKSKVIGRNLKTPPVNIGPRSTPNYASLAEAAVEELDGNIKSFAGQRDDTFWVDLGSIFDLGGLRPFNAAHLLPLATESGVDGVGGYNTHAIALQIPISQLKGPKGQMVIGVYANASRQKTTVLRKDGTIDANGGWVQVSRLGNPLINEVIIPLGKKDMWNRNDPQDDKQFLEYYRTPELAGLVNLLYPSLPDARTSGRDDLAAILLTGLTLPDGTNLNFTGPKQADLLRLNMAIAPTHEVGEGDPLGVLNGDLAGFPNGRRLEDDVTDIELRAVADGYGTLVNSLFGDLTPNNTPNNQVGDGVNENDLPLLGEFPYQSTPHQGYEHEHHRVGATSTPNLK